MTAYARRGPLPNTRQRERVASLLRAMAHPDRLATLLALGRRGALSAGELQRVAGAEQSAMSHQLRVLRKANLVTTMRRGREILYALEDEHVAHILEEAVAHALEGREPR